MRAAGNNVWLAGAIATAVACSFDAGTEGASVGLGGTTMDGSGSVGVTTKPTGTAGPGPGSGDSEAVSDSDEGSSGPPLETCEGGGLCVPSVPDGWSGPVVLGTWTPDMTALACPQDWAVTTTGGNQLDAPLASCGCACTPTTGECAVAYTYYDDPDCRDAAFSGSVGPACTAVAHFGRDSVIAVAAPQNSACTPAPTANVQPAAWAENAVACEPPSVLGECDEGSCLPEPPFGDYCVSAPGDQPCPAGPFVARRLVYRNITDTRACTPCECGMTAACAGSLREWASGLCLTSPGTVAANGTCVSSHVEGNTTFGVGYDGPPPNVACAASNSVPTGSASAGDPITFCCT